MNGFKACVFFKPSFTLRRFVCLPVSLSPVAFCFVPSSCIFLLFFFLGFSCACRFVGSLFITCLFVTCILFASVSSIWALFSSGLWLAQLWCHHHLLHLSKWMPADISNVNVNVTRIDAYKMYKLQIIRGLQKCKKKKKRKKKKATFHSGFFFCMQDFWNVSQCEVSTFKSTPSTRSRSPIKPYRERAVSHL